LTQCRQAFVFAHAARLGWHREGGVLAQTVMELTLKRYGLGRSEPGGFVFSLGPDGETVDGRCDTYGHAFVLFALAALHRYDDDARWLAKADETIAFLDRRLTDNENGGLFDAYPVTHRERRQNAHMHLLEAYLALEEAAPGRGYGERAAALADLFVMRMYRPEYEALPELFGAIWGDLPIDRGGGGFEPGHHFEWIWLLRRCAHLTSRDLSAPIAGLRRTAHAHGVAEDGLLFDLVALDGQPLRRSRRLWTHTEALKAAAAEWRAGDGEAPRFGAAMIRALFAQFLDRPFPGGWIDHFEADGRPLVNYVPATSLYHLTLAASEAIAEFVEPESKEVLQKPEQRLGASLTAP
jgi:mannose-6-phosphate isomerase